MAAMAPIIADATSASVNPVPFLEDLSLEIEHARGVLQCALNEFDPEAGPVHAMSALFGCASILKVAASQAETLQQLLEANR